MGSLLALSEGMRTLGLLLTLLAATPQAATDQKPVVPEGTVIASAQVTGFDIDRLSPGLREEIRNLASTPLKQERLDALAARIEAERPRHVAAVRAVMEPDGQARVFFVVGRQEAPDRDDNVNDRYIVEEADITGVPEAELTQALRDDLRAVIGNRLDSAEADRLQERIESDLPGYDVSRRIKRGSEVGRVRLVYEARKKEPPPWLRFESLRSNFVYHSEQGGGAYLDVGIGDRDIRFTPIAASTMRTIWSRSTPATDCASKRGSWARAGSARASSGPGSTRTGAPPRSLRSRPGRDSGSVRATIDDYAAAEVRFQPGPQHRRGREHLRSWSHSPRRRTHRWRTRSSPRSSSTGAGRTTPTRGHHVEGSFGVRAGSR